jgi:hypothetical protein
MMEIAASPVESLAYEAPFLIEKLLKERIVDTKEEAEALFTEVKRFILLVRSDETTLWDMHSLRIDEAWHQFVLFTAEYIEFSLSACAISAPTSSTPRATLRSGRLKARRGRHRRSRTSRSAMQSCSAWRCPMSGLTKGTSSRPAAS